MSERQAEAPQRALDYLQNHQVMTLATDGPQGLWAAAVFYVSDGFELYFLSAEHTRHSQNVAANERVAATIQEDYSDWPDIKGVQLEGVVHQLVGQERQAALELYQIKYPFIKTAGEKLSAALETIEWYRLIPDRFYFIDNSQGFGHRDEIDLNFNREL